MDPDLNPEKENLDPIPQKMKNLSLFVQVQNLNPSQDLGVNSWLCQKTKEKISFKRKQKFQENQHQQ